MAYFPSLLELALEGKHGAALRDVLEVGREHGLEQGRQEGRIEATQEGIIDMFPVRFGLMMPFEARQQICAIKSLDDLRRLQRRTLKADTLEAAKSILLQAGISEAHGAFRVSVSLNESIRRSLERT